MHISVHLCFDYRYERYGNLRILSRRGTGGRRRRTFCTEEEEEAKTERKKKEEKIMNKARYTAQDAPSMRTFHLRK